MSRTVLAGALLILAIVPTIQADELREDLRKAVRSGDVDQVRSLLDSGADVNTRYENQFTPIYFATDPKMVDLLIKHGAKLNIRDSAQLRSPIEDAAECYFRQEKNRENWKVIVAKLRAAGAEYTIDTAIYLNDIAFVKDQLAKDASWVNRCRSSQSVPLRIAARTGRTEICKLFLEHKADPNDFEQGNGYPILADAVHHPAVVKLLIAYKANLKRRITWLGASTGASLIGDEATVLHYAVRHGNLESVRLLIAAGLDPNAADDQGQTPLHVAIKRAGMEKRRKRDESQLVKIVELLLENDASLNFPDRSGRTALESAKFVGSSEQIRDLLLKKQQELDQQIQRVRSDNQ